MSFKRTQLCLVVFIIAGILAIFHVKKHDVVEKPVSIGPSLKSSSSNGSSAVLDENRADAATAGPAEIASNDWKSLSEFQDELDEIGLVGTQSQRFGDSLDLLYRASVTLSVEDFELLCSQIEDLNIWKFAYQMLGKKYGLEKRSLGYEWLRQTSGDSAASSGFMGFSSTLSVGELDKGFEFLKGLQNRKNVNSFLRGILDYEQSSENYETRVKRLEKLINFINENESNVDSSFAIQISNSFLEKGEPIDAIELIDKMKNDSLRDEGLRSVFNIVSSTNPAEGIELLNSLPKRDVLLTVDIPLTRWFEREPAAASEWALAQEDAVRDASFAEISKILIDVNPRDSLEWASQISDKDLRTNMVTKSNAAIARE